VNSRRVTPELSQAWETCCPIVPAFCCPISSFIKTPSLAKLRRHGARVQLLISDWERKSALPLERDATLNAAATEDGLRVHRRLSSLRAGITQRVSGKREFFDCVTIDQMFL